MNDRKRVCKLVAGALLAAACIQGQRGEGEAYRVGDPWAAPAAGGGAATAAAAKPPEPDAAPAAAGGQASPAKEAPTVAPTTGSTVLERLDAAKRSSEELAAENKRLTGELAALNAVVEQLKRDNRGLADLAQANSDARAGVDGELETTRGKVKELELRARQLADDLLAERIKRVRVERQLILAKVAEAESQGDG